MGIEKKIENGLTASEIADSLTMGYSQDNVNGNTMSENKTNNKTLTRNKRFSEMSPDEQEKFKKRQAEIRKHLNQIELSKVLKALSASQSKQKPEYWRIPEYGIIKTDKQQWEKHDSDEKGWGGVYLVKAVKNIKSEYHAIRWMQDTFGLPPRVEDKKIENSKPETSPSSIDKVKEETSKKQNDIQNNPQSIPVDEAKNDSVSEPAKTPQEPKKTDNNNERKEQRKKLIELMNSINIKSVFEELGAEANQDGDPSKWKISGIGNFIHKGQAWKNVNHERKGYGGVQLVQMALEIEFFQALQWMVQKFGTDISEDLKVDLSEYTEKAHFTPPENTSYNIQYVRRYLTNERGIPSYLVDKLIDKGTIYAEKHRRCVFISQAAAELRSTGPEQDGTIFKGCCVGSQTDLSGFSVMPEKNANEQTISLVEAAIDALSYNALFPGRAVFSTNGSGRFLLQYKVMLEALNHEWKIKAAFDADWAGDLAAQKLFNALYIRSLLAHNLKVEPEIIDTWILDTSITFNLYNSPHMNFFNEGWDDIKKEFDLIRGEDEEGKPAMIIVDNGKESVPVIEIEVVKDLHPKLLKGKRRINVVKKGYEILINEKGLARERAINKKDWNEEMLMLGSKFTLDYEKCAGQNFKELPQLPKYLEQYRSGNPMNNVLIDHNGEITKGVQNTSVNKPKI